MRVFVTGASGHIGSAVIPELKAAGHTVVGLARSDASAAKLKAAGAEVHRGDLDDLDSLRAAAKAADGVIHLAYRHDLAFSGTPDGFVKAAAHDLLATQALGEALAGTGKPLVTTGGTAVALFLKVPGPVTEELVLPGGPRADSENTTIALAAQGVRSSVVRLAPSVHSTIDREGFLAILVGLARKNGYVAYVGEGANQWNAVNTFDAANLYRLALESAPAGSRLHGVAEGSVKFRDIAETIGKRLGMAVKSVTPEEAGAYYGPFAMFAQLNNPASSELTRKLLPWKPKHPTLLEDLAGPHYFSL